jgi:hypothetical protein
MFKQALSFANPFAGVGDGAFFSAFQTAAA